MPEVAWAGAWEVAWEVAWACGMRVAGELDDVPLTAAMGSSFDSFPLFSSCSSFSSSCFEDF